MERASTERGDGAGGRCQARRDVRVPHDHGAQAVDHQGAGGRSGKVPPDGRRRGRDMPQARRPAGHVRRLAEEVHEGWTDGACRRRERSRPRTGQGAQVAPNRRSRAGPGHRRDEKVVDARAGDGERGLGDRRAGGRPAGRPQATRRRRRRRGRAIRHAPPPQLASRDRPCACGCSRSC